MKLAFGKGQNTIFNKAVRWWTGGPYVHVELVFSDGVCYSSLPWLGVRLGVELFSPEEWTLVNFPVSAEEERWTREWAESSVWRVLPDGSRKRRGYDWLGVFLTQGMPLETDDSSRYFCSEAVVKGLQKAGWLLGYKAAHFSPNDLYRKISSR